MTATSGPSGSFGKTVPRVSVVIATHNRAGLLPKSVASIRAQTFEDFEIVIVDDASSDATPEVLARLKAEDSRIRSLRAETNLGPGGARNLGIAEARGELVAILDDDDHAVPHRLATQVAFLDHHPEVTGVVSMVRWVDHAGATLRLGPGIIRRGELPRTPDALFELLILEGNYVTHGTLMIRRPPLLETPYPTDLRAGEDWLLFMQLTARGHAIASQAEDLVWTLRDPAHVSLMADKARAFKHQRRALEMLRDFLRVNGITRFNHLQRRGEARQLVREARYWYGWRGLVLILRALTRAPHDSAPWHSLAWLGGVAGRKVLRRFRLERNSR